MNKIKLITYIIKTLSPVPLKKILFETKIQTNTKIILNMGITCNKNTST